MTTARERMIALSGLAGAHTAREHFLAIMQTGGGLGTAFASMFSVRIDEPTLSLVQRAKREAAESVERSALREENERSLSVLTVPARMSLFTADESLTVCAAKQGAAFVVKLDEGRLTVKQSDVLEMIDG